MARTPRRVQVNGTWYDVREGWAGKLELCDGSIAKYTAETPYTHIPNLFHVYDGGSKIGEFNTEHGSCSGSVNGISM
jgi:hypothetical protein